MTRKTRADSDSRWDTAQLTSLIVELEGLVAEMTTLEASIVPHLQAIDPTWRESVVNLIHYLALRRHDMRGLQERLAGLGLSSLGRAEQHVLASVSAVLEILRTIAGTFVPPGGHRSPGFTEGSRLLAEHTERLLGPRPGARAVRMMVTMPSEAADDYLLVRELLAVGMDCMRINCAHDNTEQWGRMVENLRRAKRELGKKCRILMDLAGPKLRTGPVAAGTPVIKWRPRRDVYGRVVAPARIWLYPDQDRVLPDLLADAAVPVPGKWLKTLQAKDEVAFVDTRGASRRLRIVGVEGGCRWAEATQTAYIAPGTVLRRSERKGRGAGADARVSGFAPLDPHLLLKKGDLLIITRDQIPGREAEYDTRGNVVSSASIACTLPEVFDSVRTGERVWLDDGKIGGVIRAATPEQLRVEITHAGPRGSRLRGEKGINLPDSKLTLSALTTKDEEDLSFIVRHAHLVGMSFVQRPEDVRRLQALLHELHADHVGIVLKIETRRGFELLPDLMLAAMASPAVGVMIARGDLAVECGYERLAEVQEEILWLCEAAHLPVIWATQVLETLAKTGLPSRAEITDAAMGERAECVMLNKGPHITEAMRVLDNILQRMEAHQHKKNPLMRQLRWWERAQDHFDVLATDHVRVPT